MWFGKWGRDREGGRTLFGLANRAGERGKGLYLVW
jgi:hypothetical protein